MYWIPILLVLSIQGFFIASIFFIKNRRSNKSFFWLATVILLVSLQLLFYSFGYGEQYLFAASLFGIPSFAPLLYGPLFYLFIRDTIQETILTKRELFHLIPIFLFVAINNEFFISGISEKTQMIEAMFTSDNTGHYLSGKSLLNSIILLGSNAAYWIKSYRLINDADLSNSSKPLFNYIISFFGLYIAGLFLYRLSLFLGLGYHDVFCFVIKLYMGVTLYFAAYRFLNISIDELRSGGKNKYSTSTLSSSRKNEIWDRVTSYLDADNNYLNSDLKLSKLADELEIPSNYISQVVNERHEGGFNRLVNNLRIEFSTNLLLNSNLKIYAVALESGFGNKSTFNQEFKRLKGCTPSKFREKQIKNDV